MAEVDPGLKDARFKVGDEVIGTWEDFAQGGLAGALRAAETSRRLIGAGLLCLDLQAYLHVQWLRFIVGAG